jgi:hypothetical protein
MAALALAAVAVLVGCSHAGTSPSGDGSSSLPTGYWSNWGQCGSHDLIGLQVWPSGSVRVKAYVASGMGRMTATGHGQFALHFDRGVIVQNHVSSSWGAELRKSGAVLDVGDADHGGACPATEGGQGGGCCQLTRQTSPS